MSLLKHWHLLLLFLFFNQGYSQIKSVNYQISFNPETDLFDCYLIIKEGNATSFRHRTQFNAQFSVLVPGGSKVELVKSYMPLQNNQNYNGVKPQDWVISNIIKKPAADPFYDYVSIVPRLSPVSAYNDLKEGDKVKLFSLKVSPVTDCGESVKLYDKTTDLASGERGMYGGDFSNGFTIGGVEQKYLGNIPSDAPVLNAISQLVKDDKSGIKILPVLNPAFENAGNLQFDWQGPAGFTSLQKEINISNVTSKHYGIYRLTVTDDRGCREHHSIEIRQNGKTAYQDDMVAVHIPENPAQLGTRENTYKAQMSDIIDAGETEVKIFPNPAQNFFNLSVLTSRGNLVKADVTDANGRLIIKNIINLKSDGSFVDISVPVSDITPGMYNVVVKSGEKEITQKLIVIK